MSVDAPPAPPSLRGAYISHQLRALTGGRLGGSGTLVAFVVGFAAVIGIGVAIVALVAPSTKPLCQPYRPCGAPPTTVVPLVNETVWRSPQFGYTLEYPGNVLSVAQQFPDGVTLSGKDPSSGNSIGIIIRAAASTGVSPGQAVTTLLGSLNGVTQIAVDQDPSHQLLGASVGHRLGSGGVYVGSLSGPQGVSSNAGLAGEAASDGRITISMVAVGEASDTGPQSAVYSLADLVMNSIHWPNA